jgi:GT2 family glycosyltransferase
MNDMNIGIVIIGRNEGERLKKCLGSVLKHNCKTVYVDSDSNDGSPGLAKTLLSEVVCLDSSLPMNAAIARNAGFKHIMQCYPKLQYIHFIDADCELAEGWLAAAYDFLEKHSNNVAVCGRLREKNVNLSIYARQCDMSWYIPPGEIESCGGIATIKASIFKKLNGFNETLIAGEEAELYERARAKGYKVNCIDAFMGLHDSAIVSLKQWWVRNIRTGFVYSDNTIVVNYSRQKRGILVWAIFIPLFIIALSLINVFALSLLLLYPLQSLRIASKLKIPYSFKDKLLEGTLCVLAKYPQVLGVVKYHFNKLLNISTKIIEYKK